MQERQIDFPSGSCVFKQCAPDYHSNTSSFIGNMFHLWNMQEKWRVFHILSETTRERLALAGSAAFLLVLCAVFIAVIFFLIGHHWWAVFLFVPMSAAIGLLVTVLAREIVS